MQFIPQTSIPIACALANCVHRFIFLVASWFDERYVSAEKVGGFLSANRCIKYNVCLTFVNWNDDGCSMACISVCQNRVCLISFFRSVVSLCQMARAPSTVIASLVTSISVDTIKSIKLTSGVMK